MEKQEQLPIVAELVIYFDKYFGKKKIIRKEIVREENCLEIKGINLQ